MEDGSILDAVFTNRWIVIVACWLATEALALANKRPGDTFTAHVRRLFSLSDEGRFYGIRRTAGAALLAWTAWHFFGDIVIKALFN